MLVVAYARDNLAVFEWGPTDPFNYDVFIVRWSVAGGFPVDPNAQEDVPTDSPPGRTRTSGYFHAPLPTDTLGSDGKRAGVNFIVEGCDRSFLGSSDCRQGWTIPIVRRL